MIRIASLVLLLSASPASGNSIEKANALIAKRKLVEAEAVVRAGMKQNPAAHGYHLALGRVLVAKEKPADAYLEFLYEGMRAGAAPESDEAFSEAEQVLSHTRGIEANDARWVRKAIDIVDNDADEALRFLGEVSKERQSHFVMRFYRAEARVRTGEFEAALKELRALSAEDPWFAPAVIQEAMTLRAMRRPDEARAAAAKARKISPDHWALKTLELLDKPLPSPAITPKPR